MSHQVVRVKREALAPCMTCPICHKLFREATTIIECLHTFCRKCIYKKLSNGEMGCCPICNIDLGCAPSEKLRPDHNLQDVRAKIFPYKRTKVKALEVVFPITVPAKRKERSLSSLVVSTPRVSTHTGLTGRRSKPTARKASRGSSFTIDNSPETLKNCTQNMQQNSYAGEPSNPHSPNTRGEDQTEDWEEGKLDPWKPLNCLVEAANRTKSSKLSTHGADGKSEALDYEGLLGKRKSRENRLKSKAQEEKSCSDYTPLESERSKKMRKVRHRKSQNLGEFQIPPQVVLDGSIAKSERKTYPIWFSLVSDEWNGVARPLPQISSCYLRIKDGSMPVSFIQKYIKMKLNLTSEDEVEIKCMGQKVISSLTMNDVVELWLQSTTADKVSATIGSSAKDFVMVLGYTCKPLDS